MPDMTDEDLKLLYAHPYLRTTLTAAQQTRGQALTYGGVAVAAPAAAVSTRAPGARYPGQEYVAEQTAKLIERVGIEGVVAMATPYVAPTVRTVTPTAKGAIPVITTKPPPAEPVQTSPPPNPITSPIQTTIQGIPGMDTIRNLLIVMVILQFLQIFGGVMAGAAGGFAAGLVRR